jgi:hypothetical protein
MNRNRIQNLILAIPTYIGTINSIIIHSLMFVGIYSLLLFGVSLETVNLTLTTIVSLEAIYLSIFIQLSVNQSQQNIIEVQKDVDEIGDDLIEISTDIEEISKDLENLDDTQDKDGLINIVPREEYTRQHVHNELIKLQKQITEINQTLNSVLHSL